MDKSTSEKKKTSSVHKAQVIEANDKSTSDNSANDKSTSVGKNNDKSTKTQKTNQKRL